MSTNHCETIAQFSIEDFFALRAQHIRNVNGYSVHIDIQRYEVFRRCLSCALCGIQGAYFLLQRHSGDALCTAHFNLYTADGQLMTNDHIIPVSKHGSNALDNLQTMCEACNQKKADNILHEGLK